MSIMTRAAMLQPAKAAPSSGRRCRFVFTLLLMLVATVTAWADNVNYYDPTAAVGQQTKQANATAITNAATTLGTAGQTTWYYVSDVVANENRIQVSGTVNLILVDGCTFEAVAGIRLAEGNTLNIYAQSAGDGCGKLVADSQGLYAAIGGNNGFGGEDESSPNGTDGEDAGTLTIYGGNIDANGSIGGGDGGGAYWEEEDADGDPIYLGTGGNGGAGGTITIYGGIISVNGNIGGGNGALGSSRGSNGNATISLSWTNSTDRIFAEGYNGTVTLKKTFVDADDYDDVYQEGPLENNDYISDKTLMPAVIAFKKKAPTCTEIGYTQDCWYNIPDKKYYSDVACTNLITDVEIPALGHNLTHHEAVPATFSADGQVEYWYCSNCKKYFADEMCEHEIGSDELIAGKGEGNATDGYYVLMPKGGKKILTLDGTVTSFMVYDDGGADGNYSDGCYSYLALAAPEGKLLQLTGSLITEDGCDYLTVYGGTTTEGNKLLNQKSSKTEWIDDGENGYEAPVPTSIGTLTSKSMLLYFYSDGGTNYDGLNLTVTLIENKENDINIAAAEHGKLTASVQKAKMDTEVTLTATPDKGYYLTGVTVTYKDGEDKDVNVKVNLKQWFEEGCNTATFVMPLAAVTVTPTFSNDNLPINMPKEGELTVAFPEGTTSFKIYDVGGADGNYSDECDGYLALTAPEGKVLQLTGNLLTEDRYDYLTVYAGTTNKGALLLNQKWSDTDEWGDPVSTSIGTLTSKSMLLYFHADGGLNYDGLDLTVALVDQSNETFGITIGDDANGSVSGPTSAKWGDPIELTATPKDGYLLESLTVTYKNGDDDVDVLVKGAHWYEGNGNAASFVMPNAAVTVTPVFAPVNGLSINMPVNGDLDVTIPESVTTFKVYDDGGADGNYSNSCGGSLSLYAPNGYYIDVEGTVSADDDKDYVNVWDYDDDQEFYGEATISLGSDKEERTYLGIYFYSNEDGTNAGLNMTVTIAPRPVEGEDHEDIIADGDITVPSLNYTRTFSAPQDGDTPDATIDGEDVFVYTTCLPTVPETGAGIKYYTLSGATATALQFTQVANADVAAETPYLVTVSENVVNGEFTVSSTGSNVTLHKEAVNSVTAGGYTFKGTTVGLTNEEAAAAGAYILQDGNVWNQVQEATNEHPEYADAYIPAFRAFIVAVDAAAHPMLTEFGETTGITNLQLIDSDGTEHWYTLDGRKLPGKPTKKGLYIHNGKKVIK